VQNLWLINPEEKGPFLQWVLLICSFPLLDIPILFAFLIFHLKVYGEEDDDLRW